MINLYGKKYAANDSEFVGTLFDPTGTANGFYKKERAGIVLSDHQGKERVFIRRDGFGPVTIRTHSDGCRYYRHATSTADENWLGTPESYRAEIDGAKKLAREIFS